MSGSNILFYDAVQLIYTDACRRVEEALKVDAAGEPYRLLTYALETAYPESIAGISRQSADTSSAVSPSELHTPA